MTDGGKGEGKNYELPQKCEYPEYFKIFLFTYSLRSYSCLHISLDKAFFKILKEPSIVWKWTIPPMKTRVIFIWIFFWVQICRDWRHRHRGGSTDKIVRLSQEAILLLKMHFYHWLSYDVSFISALWMVASEKGLIHTNMHMTVFVAKNKLL